MIHEATSIKRLAWATDIHLDHAGYGVMCDFAEEVNAAKPDALVITGDIGEADNFVRWLDLLNAKVNARIFFVLGNHDFYNGRIADVRREAVELSNSKLCYLPDAGVIRLSEATSLIGCDGWGDVRFGGGIKSRVMMQDHYLIHDLAVESTLAERAQVLQRLADADAARVHENLTRALESSRHVILATHVPPYREACWHNGAISDDDWLPHFACKAVGQALSDVMQQHPSQHLTVLCGHTHGAGRARIAPNIEVITGAARYGAPKLHRVIEVV